MRRMMRTGLRAIAIATVASMLVASAAYAEPAPSLIPGGVDGGTKEFRDKLENKHYRVEQLKAQLDELDRQLEISVEAYNGANVELLQAREELNVTNLDLAAAETALGSQQSLLETRVTEMYRSGDYDAAIVLFSAKSIPEFFSRLQFVQEIGEADAGVASELSTQRDQIANHQAELKRREVEATALEFTLRARKIEIESRIADREAMLKNAEREFVKLLESEEARRSGLEQTLWREILLGASASGLRIEPGGPVETALAYHGVPYVWGGESPRGFDCSGLVQYVMAQHGVSLVHHAATQFANDPDDSYTNGVRIRSRGALKPGDLVYFGSPVHHVGMYMGNGYFIHAPRRNDYVKVSRLAERSDFAGGLRFPWAYRLAPPTGARNTGIPTSLPVR